MWPGSQHRSVDCFGARWPRFRQQRTRTRQHLHHLTSRRGATVGSGKGGDRVMHGVLIVEDDAALLRGLKDNFEAQNYRVETARDGQSGLSAALARPPDLMVLDIM